MKRIMIIGVPGSGKSTLAKNLSSILGIEAYYIDNIYWNEFHKSLSHHKLKRKLRAIIKQDNWIIDGSYFSTIEQRFSHATDCFILDVSKEEWEDGIRSRTNHKVFSLPWIQNEEDTKELIEWSKGYNERNKDLENKLIQKYPNVKIHILHSRNEINKYLEELRK